MNTIKDYIESLFLGVPKNEQTNQLKTDLLANSEDRYDDLKAQGKSENEAIGAVIAEFGNIEELLEEMNLRQDYEEENGIEIDEINVDEAISFLAIQRKSALLIGLGVMIIVFGLATFFLTQAFYDSGFGILFLFLGAAVGVPLFIIAGTSIANEGKKLDDRLISVQVKNEVKKKKDEFQRSFVFCMVVGVVLCILSLIPLIVMATTFDGIAFHELLSLAFMMYFIGGGVFFFIFGGVIMGSHTKLIEQKYFISDEDKIGPKAKADLNKNKPVFFQIIEKIYWPIIVGVYLFQSFVFGNWGTSWILFPIAGILFGVLESIFSKA